MLDFSSNSEKTEIGWVVKCEDIRRIKRIVFNKKQNNTVICCLTTGIGSEKCIIRRFHRYANNVECTYTNLDITVYYTPKLYGIASYSWTVQHVTVLNIAGNCNTMIFVYLNKFKHRKGTVKIWRKREKIVYL